MQPQTAPHPVSDPKAEPPAQPELAPKQTPHLSLPAKVLLIHFPNTEATSMLCESPGLLGTTHMIKPPNGSVQPGLG